MVGDATWQDVTHAGAFLLGAVIATIATLRVVRSVVRIFGDERRRPPPSDV